jgi:hypothetical protein
MKQTLFAALAVLATVAAQAQPAKQPPMTKQEIERYCAPDKNNHEQAVCCARMVDWYSEGLDGIPGVTPTNKMVTKTQILDLRKKKTPECEIYKAIHSSVAR